MGSEMCIRDSINLNLIVASVLGPMLANSGYTLGFTSIIVFGIASAILVFLLKKPENA